MNSIGEILRAARHGKQLALEDVARATRIKLDILEKIVVQVALNLWEQWHRRRVEPSPAAVVARSLPKIEYEAYDTPKNAPVADLLE